MIEDVITRRDHERRIDHVRAEAQTCYPDGFVQSVRWTAGRRYEVCIVLERQVIYRTFTAPEDEA